LTWNKRKIDTAIMWYDYLISTLFQTILHYNVEVKLVVLLFAVFFPSYWITRVKKSAYNENYTKTSCSILIQNFKGFQLSRYFKCNTDDRNLDVYIHLKLVPAFFSFHLASKLPR
jgi:hypothetical protein